MQHLFSISAQISKVAAFWLITATPGVVTLQPTAAVQPAAMSFLAEIHMPPSNPRRR